MLAFPRFCLGTHNLIGSGGINTREINKIYMKALDKNIKFYDTADEYGKGNSEIILGKFIRNNKLSSKVKIASKIGQLIDFSPYKLQKSIDNSLKRLNIERLDIMYFHSGSNKQFFNDNFWKIMNKNKSLGKIKHLGLSLKTKYLKNNDLEQLKYMDDYGIEVLNVANNIIFDYTKNIKKIKNIKNKFLISRIPFANGFIFNKNLNNFINKNTIKKNSNFLNKNNINQFIKIKKINRLSTDKDLFRFCLKYNLKFFNSVVFGVSRVDQLKFL